MKKNILFIMLILIVGVAIVEGIVSAFAENSEENPLYQKGVRDAQRRVNQVGIDLTCETLGKKFPTDLSYPEAGTEGAIPPYILGYYRAYAKAWESRRQELLKECVEQVIINTPQNYDVQQKVKERMRELLQLLRASLDKLQTLAKCVPLSVQYIPHGMTFCTYEKAALVLQNSSGNQQEQYLMYALVESFDVRSVESQRVVLQKNHKAILADHNRVVTQKICTTLKKANFTRADLLGVQRDLTKMMTIDEEGDLFTRPLY
ncbi:MAG: hypothetical protein HQK52_09220 [Oligoflexia bacterium]|nr:hypothetical protein [Oligoflexia bacterium]